MDALESRDLDNVHDSRDGLGSRGVERLHGSAEHRRTSDDRVEHALLAQVEAVDGLAREDLVEIGQRDIFADVLVLRRRTHEELFLLRDRKLGGGRDDVLEVESALRLLVDDRVTARRALGGVDAPLSCGGALEHRSSGRAGLAHAIEEASDAPRAIRILRPESRIADALLDLDARPIGTELVSDDRRQRRTDSRPHFGTVRDDGHETVGRDAQKDVRVEILPGLLRALRALRAIVDLLDGLVARATTPDEERTRGETLKNGTTGDQLFTHHLPPFFAAV